MTTEDKDGAKEYRSGAASNAVAILSLLVALVSILVTGILQWRQQERDAKLRGFETTFLAKQTGYAAYVGVIDGCFVYGQSDLDDVAYRRECITDAYTRLAALEPFLLHRQNRRQVHDHLVKLIDKGLEFREAEASSAASDSLVDAKFFEVRFARETAVQNIYKFLFYQTDNRLIGSPAFAP